MGYNQAFVRMSLKVCEDTWEPGYILRNGEMGILRITTWTEENLNDPEVQIKIGNGVDSWDNLPLPNSTTIVSNWIDKVTDLETRLIALENRVSALEG